MIIQHREFLKDFALTFGIKNQMDKLKEELAELLVASCHYQQNKTTLAHLTKEIADVECVIAQIKSLLGIEADCEKQLAGIVFALRLKLDDEKLRRAGHKQEQEVSGV